MWFQIRLSSQIQRGGFEFAIRRIRRRVPRYAQALQTAHGYCGAHVPVVHLYDAPMSIIVMRYLEPPHIILRGGIIAGTVYPHLADHVGEYLATTLFGSSALSVGCEALRAARQAFGQNEAMCALTEQVIFTEPYAKASNNHWTAPQLDDDAAALRSDGELKGAICALKSKFACDGAALLHGDLHTGSIMCTESTTFVIDHEFAFYGPMGFDVGAFLANLLLARVSSTHFITCHSRESMLTLWVMYTCCTRALRDGQTLCGGGWLERLET